MRILGAMDIGTNSVRLAVVELQPNYTWTTLAAQRQVVRLGEGEFHPDQVRLRAVGSHAHNRLTEAAIDRGALVCARFAEMARGYGAEEIIALATAAVREAENQDEFVARVRKLADLDVRVISGPEEARLIYLGVASGIEIAVDERVLFLDIGGGSTELIVGDNSGHLFLDSLRLGAIRLTAEFLGDGSKAVVPSAWAALTREIRSVLVPAARSISRIGFQTMCGSSGTIINLAEIAAAARPGPPPTSMRNFTLQLSEVQAITRRLISMPIDQRRRLPGINPDRADILMAGAAIVQTVMETVEAGSLKISDRGVLQGIIVDRMRRDDREGVADFDPLLGARRRSIRQLMRATGVDEAHAAHIVRLSLSLFDQWKSLGLHDYGRARELLEYAALLHDCGFFVSHTNHQQHSYYLIRHSELLGFNDREIEIIANVALYHRKALPRSKHPNFGRLDSKTRRLIRVLSCALRFAEAFDRGHLMLVKEIRCERISRTGRILMTMIALPGAQLELWAAEAHAPAFEKTFGLPLEIAVPENAELPLPV